MDRTNSLSRMLREKLTTYSSECRLKLEGTSFLLSFSGGIDSTIMASLMVKLRNENNFKIGFAHINHHAHSKAYNVERFCSKYSHVNNVVFHLHELFFDSQRNFEAHAREKRYTILEEISKKYSYHFILTAHHQDDQLETLYMKKMDGGDWISQIGIRERLGKLRRPFLDICKTEITVYAKQHNIYWIEDPTNTDMAFRRNKIRHLQLPQAFQTNSRLAEILLNSAKNNVQQMRNTTLKLKNDEVKIIKNHSQDHITINRIKLKKYNIEELKLFIYISIKSILNINLSQKSGGFWREFKNFINHSNTGSIFKINNITFIINRDNVDAINNYEKLKIPPKVRLCHDLLWFSGQFKSRDTSTIKMSSLKNKFNVSRSLYNAGLYIRTWEHGDRMVSATSGQHLSVSDLYINNKLSKYEKLTQPVMVDNNNIILWIPGLIHAKINYKAKEQLKVINWV